MSEAIALISLAVVVIVAIPFIKKDIRKDNEELDFLKESGFHVSSYIYGSNPFVAFDHDNKIMAIVSKDAKISQHSAGDIIDYRWEWKERNAVKLDNVVIITLKDIKKPIQKIQLISADSAETLMGKIANL